MTTIVTQFGSQCHLGSIEYHHCSSNVICVTKISSNAHSGKLVSTIYVAIESHVMPNIVYLVLCGIEAIMMQEEQVNDAILGELHRHGRKQGCFDQVSWGGIKVFELDQVGVRKTNNAEMEHFANIHVHNKVP